MKLFSYSVFDWLYCKEIRTLNSWCFIAWNETFSTPLVHTKESCTWQPNTWMPLKTYLLSPIFFHTSVHSFPSQHHMFCARTEVKAHSSSHLHSRQPLQHKSLCGSPYWGMKPKTTVMDAQNWLGWHHSAMLGYSEGNIQGMHWIGNGVCPGIPNYYTALLINDNHVHSLWCLLCASSYATCFFSKGITSHIAWGTAVVYVW